MVSVKSVKIDGQNIYFFNSAIYIFKSSTGHTLQLDIIVSEVTLNKYKNEESLILEVELLDGRIISSIMLVNTLPGGLPQLNLFYELAEQELDEYDDFLQVDEGLANFPNIEQGLTLAEIRNVEMPNEKINLKLNLPIDQVEWLKMQKTKDLNSLFKELLNEYLKSEEA